MFLLFIYKTKFYNDATDNTETSAEDLADSKSLQVIFIYSALYENFLGAYELDMEIKTFYRPMKSWCREGMKIDNVK